MTEYTCPMHPEVNSPKPGDCPICGMALEATIPNVEEEASNESTRLVWRFWLSTFLSLPVVYLHMFAHETLYGWWIQAVCTTLVIFIVGWPITYKAILSFTTWHLNMFSLIGIGVFAAYFYSLFAKQFYFEAAAVIYTLVLLGQWLEAKARKKTGEAIASLLRLAPDTAILLMSNGQEKEVSLEEIHVGDQLLVRPGAKVPLDGKVVEGESWVNEAMITGESEPAQKKISDKVIGGTLNNNGAIIIEVEKVGKDTVLSQIIALVANARSSKAPVQHLADQVSEFFVPVVMLLSVLTFSVWRWLGVESFIAIEHAIAVLIIACPCALGLATPLAMMVGLGKGAQNGVLIKDAATIELMEKANYLVVDKTGTLTYGKPKLTKIVAIPPFTEQYVLQLSASLERLSEHPIANAVVQKNKEPRLKVSHFQAVKGLGIQGEIDENLIQIGSASFMNRESIAIDHKYSFPHTVFYVAKEKKLIGIMAVEDSLKESATKSLQKLQNDGMTILMATGDSQKNAEAIATALNITFIAEVNPEEKLKTIKDLQKAGHIVAMAGDGVNDAPALAQADVGIAMGGGTDVAIANASITLLHGDLKGIVKARVLSQKTMKNVRENLFLAFAYNLLALPLAAGALVPFGLNFTPIFASLAMTLSSLSVVLNAFRVKDAKIN